MWRGKKEEKKLLAGLRAHKKRQKRGQIRLATSTDSVRLELRLDENNFHDYLGFMNFIDRVRSSNSLAGGIETVVSKTKKSKAGERFLDRGQHLYARQCPDQGKLAPWPS